MPKRRDGAVGRYEQWKDVERSSRLVASESRAGADGVHDVLTRIGIRPWHTVHERTSRKD